MRMQLRLPLLYALFGAIAGTANLCMQATSIAFYTGPFAIEVSIALGIAIGLPIKYLLDKRYIFKYKSNNIAQDGRLFIFYSMMGIISTLIFLGFEYSFHWIFHTDSMRYLGGAIGTVIGYTTKYQLDKRFVFIKEAEPPATRT